MNMTVISPPKSSTVIMPYWLPELLGDAVLHARDEPGDGDLLAVLRSSSDASRSWMLMRGVLGERDLEPGERVVGDVEAEHLALEGELVLLGPLRALGHLGRRDLVGLVVQAVEVEPDRAVAPRCA